MKIIWDVIGVALILAGGVWFMQGIGLLGGSPMSGQNQWAIAGSIAILVGVGMLLYFNRREAS